MKSPFQDPERLLTITARVTHVLWDIALLVLILSLFLFLGFWHSALGGFHSTAGAAVGALWLLLFFSPAIDRLLNVVHRARRSQWFHPVMGVIRVARLAVAMLGVLALFLLWLTDGSPATLKQMLRRAGEALFG